MITRLACAFTDKGMIVLPFLSDIGTENTLQLEIESDTDAYRIFKQHFDMVWNDAKVERIE